MFLPVTQKFPAVPDELTKPCPALNLVKEDTTQLSEILMVVTKNYSQYHECQAKVDAWNEWHKSQKKIFETVNEH
jgi:hypothetical protein